MKMAVRWTSEQEAVIHSRGSNLLVAAAAGAGKTAVLTARILDRLMEKPNIDIDELLIVTFTEAAASEMKERIRNGIEKALKENPADHNLQRQSALVYCARITTIHSFCLSVVRENFHVLDLDPGFRIAEEGERKLLMHDVLDELLEEKYEEASEDFQNLVESVVTKRDDAELEEQILRLYEYAESNPDPEGWLRGSLRPYEAASPEEMLEAGWFQEQFRLVRMQLQEYARSMESVLLLCQSEGGPGAYIQNVQEEVSALRTAVNAKDYYGCRKAILGLSFGRLKAERGKDVDPDKKKTAADIRKGIKENIAKLKDEFFGGDLQKQWEDMKLCEPVLRELIAVTMEFGRRFEEKKREQNVIDFSDMEHLALRILTREENGEFVPTDAAKNYQRQFREIMIDEYQDSNLIQEVILRSVSGNSRGEYNLFMVGDVKQSIYRFRLARPELFMEKYSSYPAGEGHASRRIDLHRNFRSRREVLDNANYIFREIMHTSIGGIEYDADAELNYGAAYAADGGAGQDSPYRAELLVVADNDRKTEARAAALCVKELVGRLTVTDGDTGKLRPCRYEDIAVLFRSVSGWSDVFKEIFAEENIPTYVGSRTGYFQAKEIRMMLQYLKLLDNPRQDFPMTAVMTSPMGGFDGNELAKIRLIDKKKPFFLCVYLYRETGEDVRLKNKIEEFLETYELLREEAVWRPLHELLFRIVKLTGFDVWMATRPDGAQKEANVRMLIQQAVRFEASSYKGVFHFVRYMEQLESYEIDYGEAELSGQTDAVQFMSIHKSKGLEFPVVILAGMGKRFNESDLNTRLLLHADAGIGIPAVDLKLRVRRSTALRNYIRQRMKMDNLGEEIRVLYVALTRAKEKMIMIGSDSKAAETGFAMSGASAGFDSILHSGSYMGLLRLAAGAAQNERELPFDLRIVTRPEIEAQTAGHAVQDYDELVKLEMLLNELESCDVPPAAGDKKDGADGGEQALWDFIEQFRFRYPHEKLQNYKMKFTVSELKLKHDVTEDGALMFQEEEVVPLLPRFLSDEETLSGAGRGTVYHKVMELLDFGQEYGIADIEGLVDRFRQEGYLTPEMAACVRPEDITAFLHSASGKRMREAAKKGKLYKEQPFVLGIPAADIYGEDAEDETLLVQGIIDVYFEEEDGLVVLDYKTDRIRYGKDLKEKYAKQLEYYAKALEQMLGKPVKEKIIYSFTLREEIIWQ